MPPASNSQDMQSQQHLAIPPAREDQVQNLLKEAAFNKHIQEAAVEVGATMGWLEARVGFSHHPGFVEWANPWFLGFWGLPHPSP